MEFDVVEKRRLSHGVFFLSGIGNILSHVILLCLSLFTDAASADDYFNPELIESTTSAQNVDLSVFSRGTQAPGVYWVDIYVNEQHVESGNITFNTAKDKQKKNILRPCISVRQLSFWGVRSDLLQAGAHHGDCFDFSTIPDATTVFQFDSLALRISIPQAAMEKTVRGYVDPALWDNGITALLLNYGFSGINSSTGDNYYANLRPGVNIGPWHFRHYSTWRRSDTGENRWDTVYTYLDRDIVSMRSRMVLGESSSPSDLFDSIPFRGFQLASDDEMRPDSQKGFAPIVRGTARTNAQIIIRQGGYVLYQRSVPPGAFEIADLYPTGGSGDLMVTVKEADGSQQHFVVPYATLPVMQREGDVKYALTTGNYRSYLSNAPSPFFSQMTGALGLSHGFTLYGGGLYSARYRALAVGVGSNMGRLGAISADVTQSSTLPVRTAQRQGSALRLRYNKMLSEIGTGISLAGYRYSTQGFDSFQDSVLNDSVSDPPERRRQRMELLLNQSLGQAGGALFISLVREDYWKRAKTLTSGSVGYNNNWGDISYGITWTLSRDSDSSSQAQYHTGGKDHIVAFNLSVPLSSRRHSVWATYDLNSSKQNGVSHTVGLSGTSLTDDALNWSAQQSYDMRDRQSNSVVNTEYKGSYGDVSLGYNYTRTTTQLSYGLLGGAIVHADGLTLSQPLGETNVLVKAPGANSVRVSNQSGAKTDFRGYTVMNTVAAYRKNDITLDPETLPENVELGLTSQTVIPGRGAVVRASFSTQIGTRVFMTLSRINGQYVPFGALASYGEGSFIVGDRGQIFLTGMAEQGYLDVRWGTQKNQHCRVQYDFSHEKNYAGIIMSHNTCN